MEHRSAARQLAQDALARGDATGWFDELYASAAGDQSRIPWADMQPNPNVDEWLQKRGFTGSGKSALVVGCGLGDDAEELSRRGFVVVAFDISPTAIAWCRQRFSASRVTYVVANVLAEAEQWRGRFDFVLEAYTLQVLPAELRRHAMGIISGFVAANGTLLVVARGRDASDGPGNMPWPLTREELNEFEEMGLDSVAFGDYFEQEATPVRRFRAEFRRR